jgi:hypothetical protein
VILLVAAIGGNIPGKRELKGVGTTVGVEDEKIRVLFHVLESRSWRGRARVGVQRRQTFTPFGRPSTLTM